MLIEVTFMVDVASLEEFDSQFDEDRIAAVLPGKSAWLTTVVERPNLVETAKAKWRKLKGEQ
jgi:hypothetical protein